jgi:TolB protein
VRLRLLSAAGLAVAAAVALAGCGGSAKPRPDLIFVSTKSGVYDLYEMNADGSDQRRLTSGSTKSAKETQELAYARDPAWSRDGRRIAFDGTHDAPSAIFVMDADGKNAHQISTSPFGDRQPTWSADGKRIAFIRGKAGALYVESSSGSGARRLTFTTAAESDPSWSPDGKWIAFVRVTLNTPTRELWLIHPDGTGAKELTALGASVGGPAWSPDSRRLAFSSDVTTGTFAIYTVSVKGGKAPLVSGSSADSVSPSWSPDGKKIAFSRDGAIVVATIGDGEKTITNPKDNDSTPVWNPMQAPAKGK